MFESILDPLLPFILIVAGIIGLLYGINKLMKSKEHESKLFKFAALGTSIVIGLLNLLLIIEWKILAANITMVHWLTILLIFLAGSSMLAEPLKDTPIAAVIAVLAFGALAGLVLLFADFSEGFANPELPLNLPLWLVILLIVAIVGLVFIATLFTEFTIDRVLQLVGWAPVVVILCALLTIQGLLMFLLNDAGGIWALTGL